MTTPHLGIYVECPWHRLRQDLRAELSEEVLAAVPPPWDIRELGMTRTSKRSKIVETPCSWNTGAGRLERESSGDKGVVS